MAIQLLTSAEDLRLYDSWVSSHPDGTLWQSPTWKAYQEALGREVRVYAEMDNAQAISASAMVVIDTTTGGFSTWDMPRGPLLASSFQLSAFDDFLKVIVEDAKKDGCISLFLSPTKKLEARSQKLEASPRHEQPEATRILDLTQSEEDILKQMHQKGRYNMKVAEKNGVRAEQSTDVESYAKMASETAKRDGFSGGSTKRYKAFLENIPGSFLLLAYADDIDPESQKLKAKSSSPIAGLIGVTHGVSAYYYYGASDYTHRALMAPYLLQWEAIKHCKAAGCKHYDLLGIAPVAPTPNPSPVRRRGEHPWSGISDFKAKFGGSVVTYPPEKEIVLKPVMKKLLKMKRQILG